jgi:hypothetical protein
MAAQEQRNAGKILKAKGIDSHRPQAAPGMTESCHECRRVAIAQRVVIASGEAVRQSMPFRVFSTLKCSKKIKKMDSSLRSE